MFNTYIRKEDSSVEFTLFISIIREINGAVVENTKEGGFILKTSQEDISLNIRGVLKGLGIVFIVL